MQRNFLSKRALLIAVLSGLVILSGLVFFVAQLLVENVDTFSNQESESIGLPAHIKIPAIDVDTNVISVGLTSDGNMDVPKGPDEVGWYNRGYRPGEDGTAVVTGHYGWKNNLPAVFDNLHKLEIGDQILVEDENGKTSTFVVRELRMYDKDAFAPEVFGSSDGKGHLNLITCAGDWNNLEESFAERLVVFADKE